MIREFHPNNHVLHLDRHYLTIICLIQVNIFFNYYHLFHFLVYFKVPYSPPEDFIIKAVDRKCSKYHFILSFFFENKISIAWSPIDSDRVHLTPAHGRRSSGKKYIMSIKSFAIYFN